MAYTPGWVETPKGRRWRDAEGKYYLQKPGWGRQTIGEIARNVGVNPQPSDGWKASVRAQKDAKRGGNQLPASGKPVGRGSLLQPDETGRLYTLRDNGTRVYYGDANSKYEDHDGSATQDVIDQASSAHIGNPGVAADPNPSRHQPNSYQGPQTAGNAEAQAFADRAVGKAIEYERQPWSRTPGTGESMMEKQAAELRGISDALADRYVEPDDDYSDNGAKGSERLDKALREAGGRFNSADRTPGARTTEIGGTNYDISEEARIDLADQDSRYHVGNSDDASKGFYQVANGSRDSQNGSRKTIQLGGQTYSYDNDALQDAIDQASKFHLGNNNNDVGSFTGNETRVNSQGVVQSGTNMSWKDSPNAPRFDEDVRGYQGSSPDQYATSNVSYTAPDTEEELDEFNRAFVQSQPGQLSGLTGSRLDQALSQPNRNFFG